MTHTVEYCEVVRAAHDTASKLLNRGQPTERYSLEIATRGGQTASVRWEGMRVYMNLPSFKPDTRMTRIEADRIVGYIAHECCHVLHSSWKVWQRATKLGPAIARLTNGIEDVRIEAAEIATGYLPNLRNVLSETLNAKHFEAIQGRKAAGKPPCGAIAADMSYVLCVLGRLANGYSVPSAANLRRDVPARFQPIVAYALKRIPQLKDTASALKLAQEVARRLAALPRPQQPQPQQPQPQQPQPQQPQPQDAPGEEGQDAPGEAQEGEEGQDAPGEAQEGQDDQDAPGEAQEGQDDQDAPGEAQEGQNDQDAPGEAQEGEEGQDAPGEAQEGEEGQNAPGEAQEGEEGQEGDMPGGTGAGGDSGEPNDVAPIDPDTGLADLVREAMERTGDAAEDPDLSPLNTFAGAKRHPLPPHASLPDYAARLRALSAKPAKLRNQIAQIIRSQERHGHERFRSIGRMDRRSIARMAAGATNVYSRRTFVPGVDTAVVVLIDGSGSMQPNMVLAHLMAVHLAEAIEAARGKVCVCGFWGGDNDVTLAIAKGFNDRFDGARLANFGIQGSTPLAASLLAAADLLREVHADRKIILALTDGSCDLGPAAVTAAVGMVAERGVECAGIGLGVDVSYAFPVNAQVDDANQLATEGLATLVRAIETGRNLTR
jgi:hypothetical protein